MRMEVDEKIKAQSERKHLKFLLCASVHVCSFDEFPPEKEPKPVPIKTMVGGR